MKGYVGDSVQCGCLSSGHLSRHALMVDQTTTVAIDSNESLLQVTVTSQYM